MSFKSNMRYSHRFECWPSPIVFLLFTLCVISYIPQIMSTTAESAASSLLVFKSQRPAVPKPTATTVLTDDPEPIPLSSVVNPSSIQLATSLLTSALGSTVPSKYPIRTVVGNLYFRLRKHRAPIMIIPPLLRIVYQYRHPIMGGLTSAFKSMVGAGAAGGVAGKGLADLATSASQMAPSYVAPSLNAGSYPFLVPFGSLPLQLKESSSLTRPSIGRSSEPVHNILPPIYLNYPQYF